jgi:hypothetical protein
VLTLPMIATATATAGKNSQPIGWVASAFNSGTAAAVSQVFRWQAEPTGNDTASPSGTLNLLYAAGTATPAETGLKITSKGLLTFAAGQTFPGTGTGNGTITGITAGTDLTGGGTSGAVTLNLDTTKVPQLATANTFTGNQTVSGNLSATGVVTGSGFQIGSNLFDYGSYANANAFLGFAGNTTTTGSYNTASGYQALYSNTEGQQNTAIGAGALQANTEGTYNTAVGINALYANTTGFGNTASGEGALSFNATGNRNTALGYAANANNLTNATAIGAFAYVAQSNTMVLGSISGVNGCTTEINCASTNVGIGTTAPISTLDVEGGSVHIGTIGSSFTAQGAYFGWNQSGGRGETDFFNNEGEGTGGWYFVNTNSSGGYSGWAAFIDSSGNLHSSSSRRWKTNIHTLQGALGKVEQLRGVTYDRKDSGKHEIGVIAEEVGAVVPEVVSFEKNGKDAAGVDYARLTALLIEATKEQQALIHKQQEEISAQQAQISRLTRQVKTIQATLKANGRSGSAVRTVKAEGTTVRQ